MEWKITPSYRLDLLGSAAAVALLSAIPVFVSATPVFANGQHVLQTGTNDSETQVQQAGVTSSYQTVDQSSTNTSPVPLQSYQLQKTGTTKNDQYAYQGDDGSYYGGNSINQVQASSGNEMGANQRGYHNTAIQYQNGGGDNQAWIGETGGSTSDGQYGAGNYAKQTQLGSDEFAQIYNQKGNY